MWSQMAHNAITTKDPRLKASLCGSMLACAQAREPSVDGENYLSVCCHWVFESWLCNLNKFANFTV